jgi:hypothetical protein
LLLSPLSYFQVDAVENTLHCLLCLPHAHTRTSSDKVNSEFSPSVAFQRMKYQNYISHKVLTFIKKNDRFCIFLIEKGSHFLRFSVITALNHVYWRLRPDCVLSFKYTDLDDKAICQIVQHFQENLSQLGRGSFPQT